MEVTERQDVRLTAEQGVKADALRIVVISMLRPEGNTGVQTHVNTLIGSRLARAFDVELVTPFALSAVLRYAAFAPGRLARPFSRPFWVWWYRESHRLALRRAVRGRLDRSLPTILYAQDPVSASVALDLKDEGYPLEVVMAVHYNGSQADEWAEMGFIRWHGPLHRWIGRFEERVIPRVDRLVFVSNHSRRLVLKKLPAVARIWSRCIPNFVGDVGLQESHVEGDLLSIGSLEPRKNHGFSLRVLAAIHAEGHPYRLTIVGAGYLRDELRTIARDLRIDHFVDFRGSVPNAGLLYRSYRACLHAATLENLPLALIESLAAGRPVFAPPTGGIPEIIEDGVEGCFLDLDDPVSSARSLIAVLENPTRYRQMSQAARSRYEAAFTAESVVPRLLSAIRGDGVPASAL